MLALIPQRPYRYSQCLPHKVQNYLYQRRARRYTIIKESPSVRQAKVRERQFGSVMVLTLLLLLMGVKVANAQTSVAESGEPMAINDVEAGTLLFKAAESGRYIPAVNQTSTVDINISGMTARVVLKQNFKNQTDAWQEGVYTFPLPDDAAVNAMRIVIGERLIEGEIKEKQKAREIFNKAKARGKKASLVEQQRPNMFTNSVANIGPGETVSVEISYIQPVSYQAGLFGLRFPMTVTPRYTPSGSPDDASSPSDEPQPETFVAEAKLTPNSNSGWAVNTKAVPDASLVSPPQMPPATAADAAGNTVSIKGRINAGMSLQSVDSAYHQLQLSRRQHHYDFSLAESSVAMTQDFVLTWRAATGSEPKAAAFTETVGEHSYATIMLLPPHSKSAGAGAEPINKEQLFIVDTSGSMGGVSIEQARASLSVALKRLQPQDWFNIIEFDSTIRQFSPQSVQASVHNVARALQMVNSMQADGGTEMLPALQTAMRSINNKHGITHDEQQARLKQIVFITDGAVSNEKALFAAIAQHLGRARLFMVGIGSAPNSHFMRKASQFGRGSFTHIGDVNEVSEKMQALFRKLESPAVTDLQVQWPDGVRAENYPSQLPDLYYGEPLVLSSKIESGFSDKDELTIKVLGRTADRKWRRELSINKSSNSEGTATVWARRKIANLLDQQVITGSGARDEVLPLALQHKLLSPFTSFVAVEKKRSRPNSQKLQKSALANAKPKGQTPQQFAFPKGATQARISFIWGAFLIAVLLVIRLTITSEERHVLSV